MPFRCRVASILFAAFACAMSSLLHAADDRPNVVLIMVDDMGWSDPGLLWR